MVSKETDTNDAMGIGEGRGSPSARESSSKMPASARMSRTEDQSAAKLKLATTNGAGLMMEVAIRCTVPSCSCECFTPGKMHVRYCDTCKHGWVPHALDKLGFRHLYHPHLPLHGGGGGPGAPSASLMSPHHGVEAVQPNVAFDIASLVLYGCQALPIRLKILLDRLFSVLQQEEVLQVLHGFGWTHEDYARGYVLTDPHGAVLDRWNMCSREEEPLVLQQFLRFGETRAITQQLLSQESADLLLHALPPSPALRALPPPPPPRIDSDIKKFIERTTSRGKEDISGPPTTQPTSQPLSLTSSGVHHVHHVQHLHRHHHPAQPQHGAHSRPPSPPPHHPHNPSEPSHHHHTHHFPHHLQLHPQGASPLRPTVTSSASLLPPPHPSQALSFPKVPSMPSASAVNGPPTAAQLGSPATPTSPLSASPLNRLQSMQPFDFRKERGVSACPPGGSPEPVPQSPVQQKPPPPPPPPPVRRRPSVASDSGLNLSVQASCGSPTRVAPSASQPPLPHGMHCPSGGANTGMGHGGFKSDVSGSEYGGSDDENSVSALNLSRDRSGGDPLDDRRRSSHHHARKATTPVKRQWTPLNLGTQLINPSTGKKRVQCNVCLKTFCDKGALKIHFSAVHLREMHRCTVEGCNMMFSSRRSRNRHSANPNPKLHSPHLRRKISPHDGRSSQPHPLLMAPPHHQALGGLPAAAAAALSPALAGLGAAGPFNAMAAAAAAAFPLLATPPPGELQRVADQQAHLAATQSHHHNNTQNALMSGQKHGAPPASVTSSSASSPSSDLKYSLDLSVHRYGDGRRTGPRDPSAGLGSSSSSSDVDDGEDDLDDDLDDEDDMAFSSHTNNDGDDEDCDDDEDVAIYLGGRSRRRRRHGDRRTASEASDCGAGGDESALPVSTQEGKAKENTARAGEVLTREEIQDKEREIREVDKTNMEVEEFGGVDLRMEGAMEPREDNTPASLTKRFKPAESSEMECDVGECSPLRLTRAKDGEDNPADNPTTPVITQVPGATENGPPSAASSSSWKAGVRKRKSRNPTRCAQPLPEERPSHVVMSSSDDDAEAVAEVVDGRGAKEEDFSEVHRESDCQPECLKVEEKEEDRMECSMEVEDDKEKRGSEDVVETEAKKDFSRIETFVEETMDLSKNGLAEEKKSPNVKHEVENEEETGRRSGEEERGEVSDPPKAVDGECPPNGGGNSEGDESLDSSHALRQLENLSHGHFGENNNSRTQNAHQTSLSQSLMPGTPASNLPFNLGMVPGLTSPPSPARSSSDRGDRDRDAESLSNPDSPSGDSSQQGLSHFRDSSGFMGAVDVPIDKENPRRCPVCGKIFQNHFGVKTHYQNVHLKLMHKCTVDGCNAAFPSKRSRDRHSANLNLHRKLLSTSSSDKSGGVFGEKSPFASLAANPALHGEFLARLYADSQTLPLNLEAFKSHLPTSGGVPTGMGGLAEHLMVNGDRIGTGGLPPPPLLLPSLGFAGFGGLDHFGAALASGMNGGRGPNSSASSGSPSPSPPMPLSLLRHPMATDGPRPSAANNSFYCLEEDDPTPEADGGLRCRFCLKNFLDGASLKEHYEKYHLSEMFGCTVEGCGKVFSSRQRRNLHSQNEAAHHAARQGNGSPSPPPECS